MNLKLYIDKLNRFDLYTLYLRNGRYYEIDATYAEFYTFDLSQI